MISLTINRIKKWLKQSNHPLAGKLFTLLTTVRAFEIPAPGLVVRPLYGLYCTMANFWGALVRICWWTPLLKGRLEQSGKNLYLYGGLPFISGPVQIVLGNNCRVSGQTTFTGRTSAPRPPKLQVGDNVDIGWMTTIAVGSQVVIGDNVRIAGRALLAGYPGHPMDAEARAMGLPETDEQVGDIVLEDDVWLATGVSVMAGVRIGRGTVVAAGSVVTRSLPEGVLAGGVPAKVIRSLTPSTKSPEAR